MTVSTDATLQGIRGSNTEWTAKAGTFNASEGNRQILRSWNLGFLMQLAFQWRGRWGAGTPIIRFGQGEELVVTDVEVFSPDLLVTEKAVSHQTVGFSVARSPLKISKAMKSKADFSFCVLSPAPHLSMSCWLVTYPPIAIKQPWSFTPC